MSRCKHNLAPLVEPPVDPADRFLLLLTHLGGYVACTGCGKVGYYTRSRKRQLRWLGPESTERVRGEAESFRKKLEEHRKEAAASIPNQEGD